MNKTKEMLKIVLVVSVLLSAILVEVYTEPQQVVVQGVGQFGKSNFTGQLTLADGTAAAPSVSFLSQTNKGLFSSGSNQLSISVGGTQTLTVTTSDIFVGNLFRPGSDNAILLGATTARWAAVNSYLYGSAASSVLTITTNVIAPTNSVHHVGAGLVKTITVPTSCGTTCSIDIVPDAAFTTDTTGNISLASTAVTNRTLRFTWDGTKWNPSY